MVGRTQVCTVSMGPEWGRVSYGWVRVLGYKGEGLMVLIPIKSLLPSTNHHASHPLSRFYFRSC